MHKDARSGIVSLPFGSANYMENSILTFSFLSKIWETITTTGIPYKLFQQPLPQHRMKSRYCKSTQSSCLLELKNSNVWKVSREKLAETAAVSFDKEMRTDGKITLICDFVVIIEDFRVEHFENAFGKKETRSAKYYWSQVRR